jgi:hypothetical protein
MCPVDLFGHVHDAQLGKCFLSYFYFLSAYKLITNYIADFAGKVLTWHFNSSR